MFDVHPMSIATKTGDSGTTALLYGKRVPKTHIRVNTYGQVDELGSALGLCRAHTPDAAAKAIIREVQGELVYLMSEIATDDTDQARFHEKYTEEAISATAVERLTTQITDKEATAGSFNGWTYAGETIAQAFFDQARTTCRRTECALIALKESGANVRPELHQYLNRLADLLWLIGREHE